MNKTWQPFFLLLIVSFLFAAKPWHNPPKADSAKKGLFTLVEGDVKKKQMTAEDWIRAQKNADVNGGDRVRTLLQARAEMQLAQLDVIRLAPQTTIDIVKLYEETKDKKIQTQINLKEGDIWGKVKSVDANSDFEVNSDFAGAAITGTVFRLHHDSTQQETQLKVYTGEVRISNVPEKMNTLTPQSVAPTRIEGPRQIPGPTEISVEEWLYLVKSYQQITIGKNGQVKSKGAFKRTDRAENSDWVKWNLQRDRSR
ncbi:FecR domain-containing protein [candidate division KSB1 bacterium]|nr:FecR domain-containing protein [candidate division KSB1 bacterium]